MTTPKSFEVKKILQVRCPQCGKQFIYHECAFRPFCSKRCRMVDLGHWFDGSYAVDAGPMEQGQQESSVEINQEEEGQEES